MVLWILTALTGACTPVEPSLRDLLEKFVAAQDTYRAEHGNFGRYQDIVGQSLTLPRGLWLRLLWRDSTGFGASAESRDHPSIMCVVFVGHRPNNAELDEERVPICDRQARFWVLVTGFPASERELQPTPLGTRAVVGMLVVAVGLVLVGLVPRWAPWGYRVLFWTPAALSGVNILLGFLILVTVSGGSGTGYTGYVAYGALSVMPSLFLNLSLFAVPAAIRRTPTRFPLVTAVIMVIGMLWYGLALVILSRPDSNDKDLVPIATGLFLIYLCGLWYITCSRRPRGESGEAPGVG